MQNGLHCCILFFQIHGICAVAAGIILGGGFVLNLLGTSNWQTPLSSPFHRFMGYLSILIFMVNIPIGIYIRNTSPEMQKHSFLYIFHDMCGHFALVAGLFIILLSTHLEYAFSPCVSKYVAGTYVVLYFSFHVVMSVRDLYYCITLILMIIDEKCYYNLNLSFVCI